MITGVSLIHETWYASKDNLKISQNLILVAKYRTYNDKHRKRLLSLYILHVKSTLFFSVNLQCLLDTLYNKGEKDDILFVWYFGL